MMPHAMKDISWARSLNDAAPRNYFMSIGADLMPFYYLHTARRDDPDAISFLHFDAVPSISALIRRRET